MKREFSGNLNLILQAKHVAATFRALDKINKNFGKGEIQKKVT